MSAQFEKINFSPRSIQIANFWKARFLSSRLNSVVNTALIKQIQRLVRNLPRNEQNSKFFLKYYLIQKMSDQFEKINFWPMCVQIGNF